MNKHIYWTTGLPKGWKVLGNGVIIVPAKTLARGFNTSSVMWAEREVSQPITHAEEQGLVTGLEKLQALAKLSQTQKIKVWDLMLNPDIFVMAYEKIKSKSGALTKSTDNETIDGFSRDQINKIIQDLKDHTYAFKPIRRVYIPKKNGKMRPLGIPGPKDKVVQTVMAIILEAIYDNGKEPIFLNSSHGFRRGRGTHTALKDISHWIETDWFIEGDIKAYFDTVNNKILESILLEKIKDQQFIDLYWKAVKADYIDLSSNAKITKSDGLPQGGPLSPILSNIYLHKLDCMMEELMEKENLNPISKESKKYKEIHTKISNKRQTIKKTLNFDLQEQLIKEVLELEKLRASMPSKCTNYQFSQVWYVRYADDFLIGVRGKKIAAEEIKLKVENFLKTQLSLELNLEKTLITNAKKDRAKFLGAELRVFKSRTHDAKKTTRVYEGGLRRVRVPSGRMIILAPLERLVKKLEDQGICRIINFSQREIIPRRKTAWINLPLSDIVTKYNQVWTGILNYYSFAWNRCQLNLIQYLLLHSLACTVMNKLKLNSRSQVFRKYGATIKVPIEQPSEEVGESKRKRKARTAEFKTHKSLPRLSKFAISPPDPFIIFYFNLRTRSRIDDSCWICDSQEHVEMHHVRALNSSKTDNTFTGVMKQMNRKQIPVCRECHNKIHQGSYNGVRLRDLKRFNQTR